MGTARFRAFFNPAFQAGNVNSEQLISDTLEVTQYLRNRFDKEKIYLMGHSGGTFIGIQAAAQAPELYHAYIGIAQMTNQLESERLAYEYMLKQFQNRRDSKMVNKLEHAPVIKGMDIPDAYLSLRDVAMHSLGVGTTHEMKSVVNGIFLPSLTFKEYTVPEKINLWRAKSQSGVSSVWNEIIRTDLTREVPSLEIPVYFFGGVYDYTVSSTLAKEYLEKIIAPIKGFYTFEHSAHSPIFEEPGRVQTILQEDVLSASNKLADKARVEEID